jgi:tetratricopeptide (TPR) repeat protein
MIAASEEMHDEKTQFQSLIDQLNEALAPRGIELKRVKWNPETDGTLEDYQAKLHDCEMCLTLYWRDLAGNSQKELNTAYQELKDGNNPRKLYVFFKEPEENLTEALKDFKASFVSNYGHFFCKFENVDTMNLHFILQFEAYQNNVKKDLVKVSDGKVLVCDKEMVNLEKVPFAALNKEYQRLQRDLSDLDEKIATISVQYAANTKDKELLKQLTSLSSKREKVGEEFEKYQTHLYDIALGFAKLSGERYSERMRKARELFEIGNTIEADQILNLEEMKHEAKKELKQFEENRHNLELKIEEFCLKAYTVMANTLLFIPERFAEACEAYQEAIDIAREIHYDEEKFVEILSDYAYLLQSFNKMYEAVKHYQEALEIYNTLAVSNPDAYLAKVAMVLYNLAILQNDLGRYMEAERNFQEALVIRQRLVVSNPDVYLPKVADTLNGLAVLQRDLGRYKEAEKNNQEALEIYNTLAVSNPDAYLAKVATVLYNLANLQSDLGRNQVAEKNYQEVLRICQRLAASNPDVYLPKVANILNNLAVLQRDLSRYQDAEKNYQEALEIRQRLASANPDAYLPNVAMTLNNLAILQGDLSRYQEAEKNYQEALELYQHLAATNPEAYLLNVATTLTNLAILQSNFGRYIEAERNFQEVLVICQRLAASNPDVYLPKVADALNNLAVFQSDLSRYQDAEKNYQEALEIYEAYETNTPGIYTQKIMKIKGIINSFQKANNKTCTEQNSSIFAKVFEIIKNIFK